MIYMHIYVDILFKNYLFIYVLTLGRHFQCFIDMTLFNLQRYPCEVNISLRVRLSCYRTLKPYVE